MQFLLIPYTRHFETLKYKVSCISSPYNFTSAPTLPTGTQQLDDYCLAKINIVVVFPMNSFTSSSIYLLVVPIEQGRLKRKFIIIECLSTGKENKIL